MSQQAAPSGLIVVDKPTGCTSHDVVSRVRRVLGTRKVGHAGTLDPSATGVLLVGTGKATRILPFVQNLPKDYRAAVQFGVKTSTQDAEGELISQSPGKVTRSELQDALPAFIGEILQVPPMVSAVKVGGEPLYKAARRGEVVDRPPRTVRVYALKVESFDEETQTATLFVRCSSGTYVRALAADLGDMLGPGAHVRGLRRLSVGSFREADATGLEVLEEMDRDGALSTMLSMTEAMRDFPRLEVNGPELEAVSHGRELASPQKVQRPGELPVMGAKRSGDRPAHEAGMTAGIPVGIVDPDGELIAVYRRSARGLKPAAVLI